MDVEEPALRDLYGYGVIAEIKQVLRVSEDIVKVLVEGKTRARLLELDGDGLANKGVIIRHLVLPGSVDETRRVLKYIAENFPKNITVSLMSQYVPCYKAEKIPPLDRKLLRREYERAVDYCLSLGLENAFIQKMDSAKREYTPVFDGKCD